MDKIKLDTTELLPNSLSFIDTNYNNNEYSALYYLEPLVSIQLKINSLNQMKYC